MLWYSPDIAMDPRCQPRGEVTSFEGHKTVFPCKVHVISNCCTVVVYGWRKYSRQSEIRDLKLEWGVSVGGWVFMYVLCLHAVYSCVYGVICVCVCVCVWNL